MEKNLPANAGDRGSWSRKILHASEQLRLGAPQLLSLSSEPELCNKRGHNSEKPEHHN